MDSIFTSLDYREYLNGYYEERKARQRSFSYRVFAEALGLDQSHLAKILLGQLHLSQDLVPAVIAYFHWVGSEAEYFAALVSFGRASTPAEAKLWFDRMDALRPAEFRCLQAVQLEYFRNWYTPVLRALLAVSPMAGPDELASMLRPAVSVASVRKSMQLMVQLGLVEETGQGFRVLDAHVGTGRVGVAPLVRDYHRQCANLAIESLDGVDPSERDVSSLVAGLDAAALDDLRVMVREFRLAIQKRIGQVEHADRVVQINFQLFPVTRILGEKSR